MSKVVDNFLKYIAFDTQSAEDAASVPSTEKQFALAKLLVEQLKALGVKDVSMSEHCYVYGTIPATAETDCPVVGFLAHMDTSPDFSDENTRPQLIQNYNGGDIILNKNLGIKMSPEVFPALKNYVGKDLITTDGTSLLGGDDKAGIAEIMTMAEYFMAHPEIPHGTIKIAFTPDEEVGHGVDFFDVPGWGADVAYTVDGGAFGEMEYETFNAASMSVTIHGQNIHPGSAKGKMKNAILIGLEFQSMLPEAEKPQYTEMYEDYRIPYTPGSGKLHLQFRYTNRFPYCAHMAAKWLHHLHCGPDPTEYQFRYAYSDATADTVSVHQLCRYQN
mgnify:CR=1 FL=1